MAKALLIIMIMISTSTTIRTAEARIERINQYAALRKSVPFFSTKTAVSIHFCLEVLEINVVSILPW